MKKSTKYLDNTPQTPKGSKNNTVSEYSDSQLTNIRRNLLAVFELAEYVIFHSITRS